MVETKSFETWAVVEVMGHNKYAGFTSEQSIGGQSFVRIDVPETDGHKAFTKLFGGASIYCITPTTEEIARGAARNLRKAPMDIYDLPDEWIEKIRRPSHVAIEPPDEYSGDEDDALDEIPY